jgi:glycosyltransferase involved in cell wall biosynthesis
MLLELQETGIQCRELPEWPRFKWKFSKSRLFFHYFTHRFYQWPSHLKRFYDTLPLTNFDVVVPFTPVPCLVTALHPNKVCFGRIFWNHRGGYDDAGFTYAKFIVRQINKKNPVMVANSTAGAQFLVDTFSLLPKQVSVIHNVFLPDDHLSNLSSHKEYNNQEGSPLQLLHVANLFCEKDIWTVLNAIKRLKSFDFPCHLHIAGFFPNSKDHDKFKYKISTDDLETMVSYYGAIDRQKLRTLLLKADIGLLSSRSEGLPNSVMEYMYARLPVIGTNIPGIREVLSEKNSDWLFPYGDADHLAKKIMQLGTNPIVRQVLGEANRLRILEDFSEEKLMPKWEQLIEAI